MGSPFLLSFLFLELKSLFQSRRQLVPAPTVGSLTIWGYHAWQYRAYPYALFLPPVSPPSSSQFLLFEDRRGIFESY